MSENKDFQEQLDSAQREFGIVMQRSAPLGIMAVYSSALNLRFLTYITTGFAQYAHLIMILREIYVEEIYGKYDLKDKTVVDVGAYLGETAIYFMLRGAKNVVCYEPYSSANLIYLNCILNGIQHVKVFKNPVVGESGVVYIDENLNNHGSTELKMYGTVGVIGLSLNDIAIQDAILKLDCEGSEHEILEKASRETIRKFSHIIMEVHKQFEDVITRLTECGFCIDGNRPDLPSAATQNPFKLWMIYAHRID